ncbi:MAG TPA: MBL fold metallo-hydrolase [Nitrospirae bacterium]|nr:MBL fold metallo-hydrolase [Nitrospirota bacterium]
MTIIVQFVTLYATNVMKAISLQSGSNGNCIYVESNGVKLLFDAGISGIQAEKRLASHNIDIRDIDALIISHDHSDHTRCAGIYHRKYGITIYATEETIDAAYRCQDLGKISDIAFFRPGDKLRFDGVSVETIPTPHDATEGSAFVVSSGGKRLGILTDLGHVFDGLDKVINSLNAVFLESNYDPEMLEHGTYPAYLKQRISGPAGHLSNMESAELLQSADCDRMKWVCLAHLSENNNRPDIALETHLNILNGGLPLYTASRYAASDIFNI